MAVFQGALLLQILTKFSSDYCSAIDGNHNELATNELFGGARINFIFTECFATCLDRMLHDEGVTENDIQTAIKNATVRYSRGLLSLSLSLSLSPLGHSYSLAGAS